MSAAQAPDPGSPELWTAVDAYLEAALCAPDPALQDALAANAAADLPEIDVAPNQGKLLHLLARLTGAKRILEIGTLGGYSAIWLARALPEGGRLVTLEREPRHAAVAQANLERAGLAEKVEIRVGPALETLPRLAGGAPFDLVFIDADKESNVAYLDWALKLARPGALVIVDNVVRRGGILDPETTNTATQGTQRLFDALKGEKRLTATALQTVGVKGWDGLILGIVEG